MYSVKDVSQLLERDPRKVAYLQLSERRLVLVTPRKSISATMIYESKFYSPDVHKHVYIHKGLS